MTKTELDFGYSNRSLFYLKKEKNVRVCSSIEFDTQKDDENYYYYYNNAFNQLWLL